VFHVYSGKFCGAFDRKPDGIFWWVKFSDVNLPEDQPVAEGIAPTMQAALTTVYQMMSQGIADIGAVEMGTD
jgi:hypothetical protein